MRQIARLPHMSVLYSQHPARSIMDTSAYPSSRLHPYHIWLDTVICMRSPHFSSGFPYRPVRGSWQAHRSGHISEKLMPVGKKNHVLTAPQNTRHKSQDTNHCSGRLQVFGTPESVFTPLLTQFTHPDASNGPITTVVTTLTLQA